ncbi:MAG: potassium channel family protein [Chlamydiota bacterium]
MLNQEDTRLGRTYAVIMAILVVIISTTFVIETYELPKNVFYALRLLDQAITVCFLTDYLMRWWVKDFSIRYLFTPMAIIDFLSVLPLFFPGTNWQFIRVIRIIRILRLLRFFRKDGIINIHYTEFHLRVMRIMFTVFCLIFIASGTIYVVEHEYAPNEFRTFFDAFYFSVVTLTTVGYGDIVPVSPHGRLFTIVIIISGVLLIPWQFMTLARYLVGHYHKHSIVCPKCELSLHDLDANYCKLCGRRLVEQPEEIV